MNQVKKFFLLCIILGFLALGVSVLAQENATEDKPATGSSVNDDKVQELKDKLATKVAELRQKQKRGFYCTVAALSKSAFTLAIKDDETRVKLSDDTQFFSLGKQKQEKSLKDLKNTLSVSVLGHYDEGEDQFYAKVILIQTLPDQYYGQLIKTDKTHATITLKTKNEELTFDYERATLASEYNFKDDKIQKSGLSRLKEGDWLHVWALSNDDDDGVLPLVKILRLPMDTFAVSSTMPEASAKASSKTSPSATPKTSPKSSSKTTPKP